jgi:hypothetical protein
MPDMNLTDDTVRRLEWLHAGKWISGWDVDQDELHVYGFDGVDGAMSLELGEARAWLSGYVAGVQRAS